MPLLLSKPINKDSAYAVWNIQETYETIRALLDEPLPDNLSPQRQAEWIIGRVLIKNLCNFMDVVYKGIEVDDAGKPHLVGTDVHISISHSFPMAAAMIHRINSCGIDLERPRHKLFSIKDKFINGKEKKYDDLYNLCAVWCGKEVLYKIYGRKMLSLKDHTTIEIKTPELLIGKIHKEDFNQSYEIHYEQIKDFYLAYSL
ncbi:MAG: 4'-phosphopantetheinyl transferase family protein [Bacteroidota bacterium]